MPTTTPLRTVAFVAVSVARDLGAVGLDADADDTDEGYDQRQRERQVPATDLRLLAAGLEQGVVLAPAVIGAHALGRRRLDVVVAGQVLVDGDAGAWPHDQERRDGQQPDIAQDVERVVRGAGGRAASAEAAAIELEPARSRLDDADEEHDHQQRRDDRRGAGDQAQHEQQPDAYLEDGQPVGEHLRHPLGGRVVDAHRLQESTRVGQLGLPGPQPYAAQGEPDDGAQPGSDRGPVHERNSLRGLLGDQRQIVGDLVRLVVALQVFDVCVVVSTVEQYVCGV